MTPPSDRPRSTRNPSPGPVGAGRATLADVARLAGVSRSTASRVLSGRSSGSQGTEGSRERVLAAADELGYVVNGLARTMMGLGPRTVAFITREMVGPTFAAVASGLEEVLAEHEALLSLSTTHGDPDREAALVRLLAEQRAAAVVLVGATEPDPVFAPRARGYADSLARVGARLVLCGRGPVAGVESVTAVDYDHTGGVRAATEHLLGLGHRRILYAGQHRELTTALSRRAGYAAAMSELGTAPAPEPVLCGNTPEEARDALLRRLAPGDGITAVVCETDLIAVGAMRAVRVAGRTVPGDVSVVGFDDMPLAEDLAPALTTVSAPFTELGRAAGAAALGLPLPGADGAAARRGGRAEGRTGSSPDGSGLLLTTRLIVRGSTGPAPRR